MKICENCKTENSDNAKYCRICGTKYPKEASAFVEIIEEKEETAEEELPALKEAAEEELPALEETAEEEPPALKEAAEEAAAEVLPISETSAAKEEEKPAGDEPAAPPTKSAGAERKRKKNVSGFAIASLCLGCMGIFSGFLSIVFALFHPVLAIMYAAPSILAIVFGIIGIAVTGREKKHSGRGLAIAGLVLGIIFTVFWLSLVLLLTRFIVTNVELVIPAFVEILQEILG